MEQEAPQDRVVHSIEAAIASGRRVDDNRDHEPERSQILDVLTQKQATGPQPRNRLEARAKPAAAAAAGGASTPRSKHKSHPLARGGKARRLAVRHRRSPTSNEDWSEKKRWLQWGFIRHMAPASELATVKARFNFWGKTMARRQYLGYGRNRVWYKSGEWLYSKETTEEMRDAWEMLSIEERQTLWPKAMLSTLYRKPGAAIKVLSATLNPLPPGYAISDVLLVIANTLRAPVIESWRRRAELDELLKLLVTLLKELPRGHMPFRQAVFGSLAHVLQPDQAKVLYDMLRESYATLHPNTTLHFARTFAGGFQSVEHKELAFSVLKALVDDEGFDLNDQRANSVITSLLHCRPSSWPWPSADSSAEDTAAFSPAQALQWLMEKGFTPNIITLTAFLDTLCERDEVGEAIRIAGLFASSGLQLDAKAHAVLLRGAKHSLDASKLQQTLELIKASDTPPARSLGNALHALYCFSVMEIRRRGHLPTTSRPNPFLPMLHLYAQNFDLQPLQSLIPESLPMLLMQARDVDEQGAPEYERTLIPAISKFAASIRETHIEPDNSVLATMLRAYIKSLRRPSESVILYEFFKARLADHTQRINYAASMVREKGTLVHDSLLMAILSHKENMRPALQLFGDMLKSKLRQDESAVAHPSPSIFTFGVLLSGLAEHGQVGLVNQILRVMEENGVKHNVATWTMQVKMHALLQNVPRTVRALQDMETSGVTPDEYTFEAFGKLRDQEAALAMMEAIIDHNQQELGKQEEASTE